MIKFFDLVTRQFYYLIDEYGFQADLVRYDPDHFGNAIVRLASAEVGMNVVLDRGQVFVYVGLLTKPEEEWFDIRDVITFFDPQKEPVYEFPENLTSDESIEYQLNRISSLIKYYCIPMLQGDFTVEEKIRQVQEERTKVFKNAMKKRYPQLRNLD